MSVTLVLPGSIGERMSELAGASVETGAVLLVRLVRTPIGDIRLLGRELVEVPDESYERREYDQLLIRSDGYVNALRRAEASNCLPIWFHTHPGAGASPRPSRHDRRVDEQLSDLFRLRADSEFYGALTVAMTDDHLSFTGHLDDGEVQVGIDRLFVVGPQFALTSNYDVVEQSLPALYDRNIRAFGGAVQRVLQDLHIAIVGCGGTGSAVAEQLVRLGVRHIQLFDSDELSDTNLTRVYGSFPTEVGRLKVETLAKHLKRISPDARIDCVPTPITVQSSARQLLGADVVFGCTDDNAGRMILSRFSTYMLVPVIDCGVLLSSDQHDRLDGIHGRVTVLHPGTACLICRGRVDLARAASEMLSPEERIKRVEEGYAPALGQVEPAVVAFTTMVAAVAVSELLERLTHYGADPTPSEMLLRLHDRELSTNLEAPRSRHYCDPDSGKLGLGETEPYLEQTWQG